MTLPHDDHLELKLVGYVAQSRHGFALPLFGKRDRANTLYVATSDPSGDHQGVISGFEVYEPEGHVWLSDERLEPVAVGSPWLDVFLWNDHAYVGTADALWVELKPVREELQHLAPLSLLDAAMHAEAPERDALAAIALAYVVETFDAARASRWRTGTLRRQLDTMVRRIAPGFEETADGGKHSLNSDDQRAVATIPADVLARLKAEHALGPLVESLTSLAKALGLDLEVPDSSGAPGQPAAPAPSDPVEPDPRSIGGLAPALVVAIGQRARQIARLIEDPDWTPTSDFDETWNDGGSGRRIQIVTDQDPPAPAILTGRYEVVVFLVDDGLVVNGSDRAHETLLEHTQRLGAVRILAPALPESRPAAAFDEHHSAWFVRHWGIHALLDTAQARSPFWWGSSRRSLDRRAADIIAGLSTAFLATKIRNRFLEESKTPGLLTFSMAPESKRTLAEMVRASRSPRVEEDGRRRSEPALPMCSETTWCGIRTYDSEAHVYFSALQTVRIAGRGIGIVAIENRSLHSDFASFAEEVLEDLLRSRDWRGDPTRPPDEIVEVLRFPDKTFPFRLARSPVGVLVTAETPSLEALRSADRKGWRVVRYTDRDTIERLVDETADPKLRNLPSEVELFDLKSSAVHRKIAVRGVDTRDIIRLSAHELHEWTFNTPPHTRDDLRREVRPIRDSRDYSPPDEAKEFAVRRRWLLDGRSNDDPVIVALASAKEVDPDAVVDRRGYKRAADLESCWTPPAAPFTRYALADGALPPMISPIRPEEIVLQTSFIIDGDHSVPALFRSRLFEVWAGATLSRSSSWMSRFSIGVTFAGFPLPRAIRIVPTGRGFALECKDGDLLAVARGVEVEFERLDFFHSPRSRAELDEARKSPGSVRLEEELFAAYGLAPDADDLSILQRLLDMNQELPRSRYTG